jgi:hypothetical protein
MKGRESFDLAQDRELVERPVERQMDFLRSRQGSISRKHDPSIFGGIGERKKRGEESGGVWPTLR